jgi:hypothetical protein
MNIVAHFNGGPYDDQEMAVFCDSWRVAVLRTPPNIGILPTAMHVAMETYVHEGEYHMRRDFLGEPVPHDLTGAIDFDWKGFT